MKINIETRKEARELLYQQLDSGDLSIRQAVKLIRKIYGLTQLEYAKKVGVSNKTIVQLENGERNLTLKSISKVLAPMSLEMKISRKATS